MVLTTSQREALKLLANEADGFTVPFLLSHGCSVTALRRLARCGLAVTDRVRTPGKRKALTVARLRISEAGRKALAR
jgi:DNA-binding PadR family transcriptional regulator